MQLKADGYYPRSYVEGVLPDYWRGFRPGKAPIILFLGKQIIFILFIDFTDLILWKSNDIDGARIEPRIKWFY